MDARIVHEDAHMPIIQAAPRPPAAVTTQLRKATDFLLESSRIGTHRSHYLKYRRYVILNSDAIFSALVTVYTSIIISQWQHFRRLADSFPAPQGISAPMYAARVYISHWFLDLYVSNREAINKISPLAFAQYFQHQIAHYSLDYDVYLCLLNAAIRPTHIKGYLEDVLYIPLITTTYDWISPINNPFGINNFTYMYDYFTGIIDIMKDRKNWNMSTLVTDTVGRPSWLFDWHDQQCCAWFPAEGNFSDDDVTIAYIIGEACSPKLAPRDVDDWTFFEDHQIPPTYNKDTLPRTVPRKFFGSYEVRTVEVRVSEFPEIAYPDSTATSKKRKTPFGSVLIGAPDQTGISSSSGTAEPSLALALPDKAKISLKQGYQYQITDWTYYSRVVLELDHHTRSGGLKTIVLGQSI